MQETAFSPAARQHTVTFPTWKCGRYTRRSATAWPLATVKIWDATTNQMRRCISPDQIEAYFIRSVPLLRVIARVDALIHPRIIYIPEYLRRTCSWFRGPWSQRRKLFTATATNVGRTVDITSCGRWRRTEKSKWINIQKANQTAERFRGTMKPLRRKQCCAWAASLASKAGSVASKKEQQEENESAAFWLASGRESLSHTSAACNTLFWALRIENFLNIDNNYNNNIESLKSSNLRGNYLHKSKLDTWSICEKFQIYRVHNGSAQSVSWNRLSCFWRQVPSFLMQSTKSPWGNYRRVD